MKNYVAASWVKEKVLKPQENSTTLTSSSSTAQTIKFYSSIIFKCEKYIF